MRAIYTNSTTVAIGNLWSESNTDGWYPPYTNKSNINNYNYQSSTWSASDGFYVRLKNVTFGYNLPENLVKRVGVISQARVYFTGTDLWEYTLVQDGWDPEAKSSPSGTARYPFMRGFSFGASLTF